MKKTIFKGVATALVTPFTEDGVNFDQLGRLIDWQIESGINALSICGTTGEAPTMTDEEQMAAIAFSIKRVNKRVPVIAGAGSNDAAAAIELAKFASRAGADAILSVTPYYNKATQKGLIKMYTAIADASDVPVILYNVPSRTGVNIEPETYAVLAEHENIAAIKEANGNISKVVETMALVGDKLDLYSGNDDQIVPLMSVGGKGVVSVLSNIMPKQTVEICDRFFAGDLAGAAALQLKYTALIKALFCEVNPIPIKAALTKAGFIDNILRLPLTEMDEAKAEKMFDILRGLGIDI